VSDSRADIAHVLRRTTFGPFPGQVDTFADRDAEAVLDDLLAAPSPETELPELGTDDDDTLLALWWLERMAAPEAGLHEKLTLFWHGHFTSSMDKVDTPKLMLDQHRLLRDHALGNFRDLVRAITIDGAMLRWLDGADSTGDAPNENYARELMEVFTLGHGTFSEADVRAGARALAGWTIDDRSRVTFDPARAFNGTVTFLGRTGRLDADDVADAVCDQPACAPFVAGRLHRFFVGTDPDDRRRAELAEVFTASGLEIRPLVDAILRDPSFMAARHTRPRYPVEWVVPVTAVLGATLDDTWPLELLGQRLFHPPNVAGWPAGPRWLSGGPTMVKAALCTWWWDDTEVVDHADPVAAALERASIYDASETTRAAMADAVRHVEGRREQASLLLALAVCAPEFQLA